MGCGHRREHRFCHSRSVYVEDVVDPGKSRVTRPQ